MKSKAFSRKFPDSHNPHHKISLFFPTLLIFPQAVCYTIPCIVYIAETKTIRIKSPSQESRACCDAAEDHAVSTLRAMRQVPFIVPQKADFSANLGGTTVFRPNRRAESVFFVFP
jgi:hypothetical protein